jgi:hypothetical protein
MRTAKEFFFAINEATRIKGIADPSDDAIEFLELMAAEIFAGLDRDGALGTLRDNIIFWEGMLKGVQLRLAKDRLRDLEAAQASNRVLSSAGGDH